MAIQEPVQHPQTANRYIDFGAPKQPDIAPAEELVTAEDIALNTDMQVADQPASFLATYQNRLKVSSEDETETDTSYTAPEKKSHRKLFAAMGGVAAAGLVSILAVAGLGGSSGDDSETQNTVPEVSIPASVEPISPETSVAPKPETLQYPEFSPARILPGEKTITATRPNGEPVTVAELRTTASPYLLFESVTGLVACYLTTGSEECLNTLTKDKSIQEKLQKERENLTADHLKHGIKDLQVVFHTDNETTRPTINYASFTGTYELDTAGPNLYIDLTSDSKWQGSDKRQYPNLTKYNLTQFEFKVTEGADGKTTVTHLDYDSTYA